VIEKINCLTDCQGACCVGEVYWRLTREKAAMLAKRGTELVVTDEIQNEYGELEYHRLNTCGLYKEGKCLAHDGLVEKSWLGFVKKEIQRPRICIDFPVGDMGCLKLRMLNPKQVVILKNRDEKFRKWYKESSEDVKYDK
jgi:hypothetical protein